MNTIRTFSAHLLLAGTTLVATLGAQGVKAQALLEQAVDTNWRFSAGLGVFSRPKYPGSDDTQLVPVPLVSANFGRFFIGGTPGAGFPVGVGANLIQNDAWRFGVALGGELSKPRSASDAPMLRGWGDISETALGSVFATYTHDWLSVRGFVVSDIGGNDQGTRIAIDVEGRYQVNDKLTLSAGPGVTWADGSYTQTFYGISAQQSLTAGIGPYAASSGLNTVRFSVGAQYQLTPQWSLGASLIAAWLQGDAEDSPVTKDKSQNTYGIFASYRF